MEHQADQARGLLGVDPVRRVGGLVIVGVRAAGEEEHGYAFHGEAVVVGPVEDPFLRPAVRQWRHAELGARGTHPAERLAQGGHVRAGDDHRVAPVPPDEIQVEVGHDVAQRHRRVLDVIPAAPEPLLLAAREQEQQGPGGPRLPLAERLGHLQEPGHAGGVVVGPVEDAVGPARPHADVVEMGGDRHILPPQAVVSSLEHRREVRRRRPLEIVTHDSKVHPKPRYLPHHRRFQRAETGQVERGGGGDRTQRALVQLDHRRAALPVAKIGRQPRLQGGVDPAGERGGVAVGEQDHRARDGGDLVHPVAEVEGQRPLEIGRQEHDAAA